MHSYFRDIFNTRMLTCIFSGFASGMPLYVLIQLVPAWLRENGADLKVIGFFALIQLPYVWKFLWAPFLDLYWFNKIGRRKTWMLATQIPLIALIAALPFFNVGSQMWLIAGLCTGIAFFSATQDIALDAFRREILDDSQLGLGNSLYVNAYRISGLIPGSLSLILADHIPWQWVFPITASFMLIAVGLSIFATENTPKIKKKGHFLEDLLAAFSDFFQRNGVKTALFMLCFMFLFKLGDSMATSLQTPFFLDIGYSKTQIGLVAKSAGLWALLVGGFIGGLIMLKIGINRGLWLFGVVQILSILGFAWLAQQEPNKWYLGSVMAFEYLGVGLGTAALVAFMARSSSLAYTAVQLAIFTALAALPRTVVSSFSGIIVERVGYESFFYLCFFCAIPGMLLLFKIAPWNNHKQHV